MNQNPLIKSSKTSKKIVVTPDIAHITQEKIINSDQLLTLIPLIDNKENLFSRILLLKIKDDIKNVVFTMYPSQTKNTKNFTGKIIMSTINGDFINGYTVKEGVLQTQFVKKKTSSANQRSIIIDGVVFEELDEVVIINNYHSGPGSINIMSLFSASSDFAVGGGVIDYSWDYGGGSGGGGASVTNNTKNPCDALKTQNSDTNYKDKIIGLKNNTGLSKETGFLQNTDGTYTSLKNNNRDQLDFPLGPTSIGFLHTHLDPYDLGEYDLDGNLIIYQPIKMFSPTDVKTFIILLNNAYRNNIDLNTVYGTVVTSTGTYTLKFDGIFSDINQSLNFDDALTDKYKKSIDRYGLEKGFLSFLKNNGINGISLYKVNSDGTTEKNSLDSNNTTIKTPC